MITVHNRTQEHKPIDINIDNIIGYEDGFINIPYNNTLPIDETREQIAEMIYAARCARYEAFARELRNMGVGC